ncbi:uncharacterized protein LOC125381154 [Haliotis rufescens]|uniref:uncharacterized protein LOC125381154 n=1 Tax=Haliotis rufescens TaxID=6454 RepID=UPI00201F49F8|nr:uncharacterized protein LOC125381154 [Haliotis rufescens]XP_048253448.1 uncharacterized protein LOC125381154 [Haliotis rufescens]
MCNGTATVTTSYTTSMARASLAHVIHLASALVFLTGVTSLLISFGHMRSKEGAGSASARRRVPRSLERLHPEDVEMIYMQGIFSSLMNATIERSDDDTLHVLLPALEKFENVMVEESRKIRTALKDHDKRINYLEAFVARQTVEDVQNTQEIHPNKVATGTARIKVVSKGKGRNEVLKEERKPKKKPKVFKETSKSFSVDVEIVKNETLVVNVVKNDSVVVVDDVKSDALLKNDTLLKSDALLKPDTVLKNDASLKTDIVLKNDELLKNDTVLKTDTVLVKDALLKNDTVLKTDISWRNDTVLKNDTLLRNDTMLKNDTDEDTVLDSVTPSVNLTNMSVVVNETEAGKGNNSIDTTNATVSTREPDNDIENVTLVPPPQTSPDAIKAITMPETTITTTTATTTTTHKPVTTEKVTMTTAQTIPASTTPTMDVLSLEKIVSDLQKKVDRLEKSRSGVRSGNYKKKMKTIEKNVSTMKRKYKKMRSRINSHNGKIVSLEILQSVAYSDKPMNIMAEYEAKKAMVMRLDKMERRLSNYRDMVLRNRHEIRDLNGLTSKHEHYVSELQVGSDRFEHRTREIISNMNGLEHNMGNLFNSLNGYMSDIRWELRVMLDRVCGDNHLHC